MILDTTVPWTGSVSARAAGAALGSGVLVVAGPAVLGWAGYLWVLCAITATAAAALAIVDARTLTLPNLHVVPLAAAALVQVAGSATYQSPMHAVAAAAASAVVCAGYAVLAAAGWCGFGDAKFAGAVTLIVGVNIGLVGIYLLPVALILSSGWLVVLRISRRQSHHAHGPAVAIAAGILMTAGLLLR